MKKEQKILLVSYYVALAMAVITNTAGFMDTFQLFALSAIILRIDLFEISAIADTKKGGAE
ncbi:hypothetical protein ACIPPQ_20400 [Sphingopyxis sp. LARHCG72]